MDMQSQKTRPYVHDQAEDPIRVHHQEEEEHQEKGATKVLKKVKEKAKKIKNSLTKHGHGHDNDHDVEIEDDEYDEQDPQLHGTPVYTGQPESLSHPGETNVPAPEEIVPPGTKVFPVVSSDYTKPVESEPLQEDTFYGHEAASHLADMRDERTEEPPSHPLGVFDMSERGESREAHQTPMNPPASSLLSATEDVTGTFTPGDDEYLNGQGKVNIERPKGFEEDPAGRGGGTSYLSGVSNYQSKVTDPSHEGGGEAGVPEIVESLGKMKVTDESPDDKQGRGFESDFPTRSHEFGLKNESESEKDIPERSDDVKVETESGRDLQTGIHDQFSPELSPPKETHVSKPSTYTEKIGSAASFVTDKAIAAKNAVTSKLGYSGQHQSSIGDETTPRSATGYGQKVAGTVADKLTPVYEKVKETGSTVMTKLPLSGGGNGAEENKQVEGKGVLTRDYLAEKLRPGEDDKALAEVIAEKLHLGGGGEKKTTTTKEVEVTVEKIHTDQILEEKKHGEEGKVGVGGGMVGKLKGAVTSWLGGTSEEVKKPKSSSSVDESSQSLGTTVGTMGFSDSGGALTGQKGLQDSGN
ncbi:unnamed protein product [Eruca vesicaria subsp. sativa]|uniref:Low-temperature-induced 65 kDa protein n=1 Tax=Eruca vesicaria subsp. sativa TaxID=29727 RepID=A0ABC8L6X7_ERUVS|nr:unnamed protein product [Eruca vesicaria subsp. sativa]